MVKNSRKKPSVTSERVPISSKPSNLDCRDSGESFDAHIVAVCKIFEKGRGFCRAPCLAVGLLYTCILQGARQAQGPCCTNPNARSKTIPCVKWVHLLVLLVVSLFGEESTQIWSTLIEFKSSEPKPQNNSEKNTITTSSLPISFLDTCIGAIKSSWSKISIFWSRIPNNQ